LANLFGFSNGLGLSDYLRDSRKIADLLLKTGIEKLSLLPGGNVPENPTELVGSKKMEDLVHELKSRYNDRYVIFDSTPLLATSESEVLSQLVDGIIIVVKAGVTPRETVKHAISSLEKEKILGFVLNHLEFRSPGLHSRYFGSGGYYYRYGYEKKKTKPPKRLKMFF
jgi:capsular exopolysaccharide synthesis family protein